MLFDDVWFNFLEQVLEKVKIRPPRNLQKRLRTYLFGCVTMNLRKRRLKNFNKLMLGDQVFKSIPRWDIIIILLHILEEEIHVHQLFLKVRHLQPFLMTNPVLGMYILCTFLNDIQLYVRQYQRTIFAQSYY